MDGARSLAADGVTAAYSRAAGETVAGSPYLQRDRERQGKWQRLYYSTPGSSDTIGITLWNGNGLGGIWFSTNWVGSPPATVEQVLGGGNVEVH